MIRIETVALIKYFFEKELHRATISCYCHPMESITTLVVSAGREPAEELKKMLDQAEVTSRITVKRNIDGDAATWILLASISVQALPNVLNFLEGIVGGRRVKKIKLGDLEIENPGRQDMEEFRMMMRRLGEQPEADRRDE